MIDASEPYIRTGQDRRVYLRDPALNREIHLVDVANALSRIARFNGHTSRRYSVASHCLMVAELAPAAFRREALMHDAVEAFLGDVTSPLKSLLADYRRLEERWQAGMALRWGLMRVGYPYVKDADRIAYAIERAELCRYSEQAAGAWDVEANGAIVVPPDAPSCAKYAGKPRAVAAWWLAEARRLGVPEVA